MRVLNKSLLKYVLLLCIAGESLAAYGMFWVTSNVVHVNTQYTVVLSSSTSNGITSLTARVRNNGKLAGDGINVAFYYSLDGGGWIHFTTQSTNRGGVAHTTYAPTTDGVYAYRATVSTP